MQKITHIFILLLASVLVISCSKKQEQYTNTTVTVKKTATTNNININLVLESDIQSTDLSLLNFTIENKDKTISLTGHLNCEAQNNSLICNDSLINNKLSPGFYRLIIKNQADFGIACDIVEYSQQRPIDISLNKDSSGECIYYQLLDDTHLSEANLRNRLNYLTHGKYNETSTNQLLYDLYHYYCKHSTNHREAWDNMVNALNNDEQLPDNIKL